MSDRPEVHSVDSLDLERYLGDWFEIGRLPLRYEDDAATEVTASYSLTEDGTVRVDNRCLDENGKPTQAIGEAKPDKPGQLSVTFLPEGLRWIPFTKADYWVLKLDADYQHALVGTPDHKHLWLLSRTAAMPESTEREYLAEAVRQGYSLEDWIRTPQTGRHVTDAMLD